MDPMLTLINIISTNFYTNFTCIYDNTRKTYNFQEKNTIF